MATTKRQIKATAPNNNAPKTRYEGELTASSKRNRQAFYYKLSEKDHETIIQGLSHFVSVYQIAAKIGCGYSTLKAYIAAHPELKEVQEDSQRGELEFVKGKFMQKIASGSLGAMCFYLERKGGWTNHQTIDANMPIPNIVLGMIPESELPADGMGEPEKLQQVQALPKKDDSNIITAEEKPIQPAVTPEDEGEVEEDEPQGDDDGFDENWDSDEGDGGLF